MGTHGRYGDDVLHRAVGPLFRNFGGTVEIDLGPGKARIDGTIGNRVAIEIESRTSKQVRGAVLDLILHPFPKKLLILEPVHMDAQMTAIQCEFILGKFVRQEDFRVVVFAGSGKSNCLERDVASILSALRDLGLQEHAI